VSWQERVFTVSFSRTWVCARYLAVGRFSGHPSVLRDALERAQVFRQSRVEDG
jgi:hypothetical protein